MNSQSDPFKAYVITDIEICILVTDAVLGATYAVGCAVLVGLGTIGDKWTALIPAAVAGGGAIFFMRSFRKCWQKIRDSQGKRE